MALSCMLAASLVQFVCPKCEAAEVDDYDAVQPLVVHAMRCDHCSGTFHTVLLECPHCESESSFSWTDKPSPADVRALACLACNRPYVQTETDRDSDGLLA
jgi:hypothetical protein